MKRLMLLVITLVLSTGLFPQKWVNVIGQPDRTEYSQRVMEHYDKGFIITGSLPPGIMIDHGWIIKTDINGNVLWDKVIGVDPDQVIIQKTVYDDQGNLYIFGTIIGHIDPCIR